MLDALCMPSCRQYLIVHALYVAQLMHLSNFDSTHWNFVKRVLRYINGTCSFGIKYCKKPNGNILIGYSDADWVGDKDTRQSTSGYCFLLVGAVVSWASKKQTYVALSSTES